MEHTLALKTHGRRYQKSKRVVSVAPQKGMVPSKFFFEKVWKV